MEYYTPRIQLHMNVIKDILSTVASKHGSKMLVFGLGYDSRMWYECTNKNTYFVENNYEYIKLNQAHISSDHIFHYTYPTRCDTSMSLKDTEITAIPLPDGILARGPFDIILIDGPEGWKPELPGRLLPCYWSTRMSKPGTIIYIDDSSRPLERYCIEKYYSGKIQSKFMERSQCTKIIF